MPRALEREEKKAATPKPRVVNDPDRNRRVQSSFDDTGASECQTCGFRWFQQITIGMYKAGQLASVAQKLVPMTQEFIALKCGNCGDLTMPKLMLNSTDRLGQQYNQLLDDVEDISKREKNEDTK